MENLDKNDADSLGVSAGYLRDLLKLEADIGITFKDKRILIRALTHRSYCNENRSCDGHLERLEFLGDAVLELVVTEHLLRKMPYADEGMLTALRSTLVQGKTLRELTDGLGVQDLIRVSRGQARLGFTDTSKCWSDVFEAIIGAIHTDRGVEIARRFIEQTVLMELPYILLEDNLLDPRGKLQELTQASRKIIPTYTVHSEEGQDHEKEYVVGVYLEGARIGEGRGRSKATANANAALDALENSGKWMEEQRE